MHTTVLISSMADCVNVQLDRAGEMDSFIRSIQLSLDDAHFQKMKQALLKTGKGAPPKIQLRPLTHRLALQLELLRVETGTTWMDMEIFFPRTVHGEPLQGFSLRSELEATVKEAAKIKNTDDASFSAFLDVNLGANIMCRNVGLHLLKHKVTRNGLLNPECLEELGLEKPTELINGMIVDLMLFSNREKDFSVPKMRQVLVCLGADVSHLSDQQLSAKLRTIYGRYQSLNKSVKRPNGLEKRDLFLSSPAFTEHAAPVSAPSAGTSSNSWHSTESVKLAASERNQAKLRRDIQELESQLNSEKEGTTTLQKELKNANEHVLSLQDRILKQQEEIVKRHANYSRLQQDQKATKQSLKQEQQTVRTIRATNMYKRLQRRQREIAKKEASVHGHENGKCAAAARNWRRKVKNLQTSLSNARIELQALRPLKGQVRELMKETDNLTQLLEEKNIIRLKDPETGYFTSEAKLLIMELVGQLEVASERCGKVIEAVCRHLFDSDVPVGDLPSARSAVRFADVGHVLSKIQVTDAILSSDRFDLHSDGTTKSGKKVVGHQVTLDSGESLACGYTVVAAENATCLVDIAIGLLEELSLVFEDDGEKRHEVFLGLLQRLSSLMTDRASVMKAYGRQLNDARQDLLQTDDNLAFLHCNAHFLLGLVGAVDKAFKFLQHEDQRIGRDTLAKFAGNRGEHAATRCIREGCAVLGPRGDERYGCREHWLAYCMMNDKQSEVTSFKANRFNNLFQASAAVHFHRPDVTDFLHNYMTGLNWKQDGILADLSCDVLDNHLIALGLMNFRVTQPYWQLLGQGVRYLDFYAYVVMMKQLMERWSEDPADAFDVNFEPLFGVDIRASTSAVFLSLLDITQERKEQVGAILKQLSVAFLEVIRNQLSDFLPAEDGRQEGKYFAVQDENLKMKLSNSKLTNLISEQCFGDLDFSVFKRRHASAHHHSTVNLMQRNHTISNWFAGLPQDRQESVLCQATAKSAALRQMHRDQETQAVRERQHLLQETKEKKIAAEAKRRQRIMDIMERLRPHQGPCNTAADVTRLLETHPTKKGKEDALKAEVMYHKLVLKEMSPLLRASASLEILTRNLKNYLSQGADGEEQMEEEGEVGDEAAMDIQEEETDDEEDSDDEEQEGAMDGMVEEAMQQLEATEEFSFKDIRPGTTVLVGYEENYYAGEVETIIEDSLASVNFMERCSVKQDAYKWPARPDRARIHAKFVLASNLPMTSANGRIWTLDNSQYYSKLYLAFHRTYFV